MSFYNMIHGVNPLSGILLASLGVSRDDVGRFRDCYWNGEHICVYTRNGGGNRACWHEDDPAWANQECGGEAYEVQADEVVRLSEAEGVAAGYKRSYTILGSDKQPFLTGRKIPETRYRCAQPNSERCSCPGCVIKHRLPKHPQYVRDEDDDFDSTYATIYFRPHPALKEALTAVPAADATPEQKWESFFERLRAGSDDPQIARVLSEARPLMDAITARVG